jgi:hypothetical protein
MLVVCVCFSIKGQVQWSFHNFDVIIVIPKQCFLSGHTEISEHRLAYRYNYLIGYGINIDDFKESATCLLFLRLVNGAQRLLCPYCL